MSEVRFQHPECLISPEALAEQLDDPALRLFDCTTYLVETAGPGSPYRVVSGRADYERHHLPGAAFLDLQAELSDADSPFRFTLPALDVLAQRFAAAGIGEGVRVVLYSRGNPQWATRVWWMLRAVGFDDAAILDGGFDLWEAQGRPLPGGVVRFAPAVWPALPTRAGLFVGRDEVLAACDDAGASVINALSAELHRGDSNRYGRAGRIPGSINVPAQSLRDPQSGRLLEPAAIRSLFEAAGVTPDQRSVIYCGGGIAATLDAFVLYQLGHLEVAVYDHSLNEWANDHALPMQTG
ncbi:MAG: sulfurtransferase [Burkholderiaceae bacterium]